MFVVVRARSFVPVVVHTRLFVLVWAVGRLIVPEEWDDVLLVVCGDHDVVPVHVGRLENRTMLVVGKLSTYCCWPVGLLLGRSKSSTAEW